MAADWSPRSMLLLESKLDEMADVVAWADRAGAPVYLGAREVIDGIAGFPVHRGVLALAARRPAADPATILARSRLLVVVEGVNNHENLGAIFRNAAAFGCGGVLLDPTTCDPLYRRSIRVSLGHVLRVPFARLKPWPAALDLLSRYGFSVIALGPAGSVNLSELAGPADRPVALMVGAEEPGLSGAALAAAAQVARIPMAAGVDSLNVATALAIALYHFTQTERRPTSRT